VTFFSLCLLSNINGKNSNEAFKITDGWEITILENCPSLSKWHLSIVKRSKSIFHKKQFSSSVCTFYVFQGKKRWVHRFTEHFEPATLTCISAGQSLVALGTKSGKIHVYESSTEFKCLRLTAMLEHHTGK